MKINTTAPDDDKYLQILSDIAKKPKTLHYAGSLPADRIPSVAIVGTRKPTAYGREVTHRFAFELASRGVVIVSGLALGVDAIAHKAALEANGTTIAVLGNGLPAIYPAAHANLAKDIIATGGAVISEYGEYEKARPHYFLERNRLVSGLADVILITEAAARSGTLNTAGHALDQGKDIFVIPGNITSPMSLGCNQLLKQGAIPATSPEDILELLLPTNDANKNAPRTLPQGSTPLETAVITAIASGIQDGDAIQSELKVSATELSTALTMLELSGAIRALGANRWTLR
jgi:DNA processing protein